MSAAVPLTTFVGRRSELAELRRVIANARLVTLVGPAGAGKTRLALELARRAARPTEVVGIAELAPLVARGQVEVTVAASFGLVPEGEARRQLVEWLRDRPALLLLDNCEHVLDDTKDLVAALLGACPRLRIVATSREPLGVDAERTWPVPPLTLPADTGVDAGTWRRSDALLLFAERARLVAPTFAITEANAARAIEICRALDGLPLAIELAATRLRNLAFEDLRRSLNEQLRLLAPPSGAPSGRHDTMRAAIEWSHGLLTEGERRVFRRLGVFSGGFDSDAARAVCSDDGILERVVVLIVSALVDRSLLRLSGSSEIQRYSFLEVVREYALERLAEAGELEVIEHRRATYVATLFDSFGPHRQKERETTLGRIFAEHQNVRGAMGWLLQHDVPVARRILGKAWLAYVFLRPGIDPSEVETWLVRALDADPMADEIRARMLIALAQRRFARGDHEGSERAAAESLQVALAVADSHAIAGAHHRLALSRLTADDAVSAMAHFADAIAHYRTTNLAGCAFALAHRAMARSSSGDLAGASVDFADALAICDAHPHLPRLRAVVRTMQGEHLSREAARDAARDAFFEALRTYTEFGSEIPIARALHGLALSAADAGQNERALRLSGAAFEMRARTGDTWPPSREGSALALAEQRVGRDAHALRSEGRRMSPSDAVAYALDDRRSVTGNLSRREAEVAKLVSEGMSSREIGRRLRITERTAETHVEHILVKLGLRSRAQIARWATEHGLTT